MNAQREPFSLGNEVGPGIDVPPLPMDDAANRHLEDDKPVAAPPPPPPKGGRKSQIDQLEEDLANAISALSMGVVIFDETDAEYIANGAEPLAHALRNLAEKNSRVKARLLALMQAGAYGEVVIAALAIILPIAMHHGLVPMNLPPGGFARAVEDEQEDE